MSDGDFTKFMVCSHNMYVAIVMCIVVVFCVICARLDAFRNNGVI